MTASAYLLERAWLDGAVRDDVLVSIEAGRFTAVTPGAVAGDATRVAGLTALVEAISAQATDRAGRDGTSLSVTAESVSGSVAFEPSLAVALATDHEDGDWPVIATQAGHDAGILSAAGIPTAMLFVRNPTGVSHSPLEHASVADCLVGVSALADTLERLAR